MILLQYGLIVFNTDKNYRLIMKKLLIAAIASAAIGTSAHAEKAFENLSVLTSVSFESEYVFRGIQLADEVIQPSVELRADNLYAGFWASVPLEDEYSEEINLYVGYTVPVNDKLGVDLGYMYYWYVNDDDAIAPANLGGQGFGYDFRNEVYFGVYGNMFLRPQLFFYYDINLDQIVVEFSAGHSYSLENVSEKLRNASIELGGYVGAAAADDVNGSQNAGSPENSYSYWGVTADLAFRIKDGLAATVGVRYAGNTDDWTPTITPSADKDNNFYWGASISAGF